MMEKKRFLLLWSALLMAATLLAGVPRGYYTAAKGKKGAALKTALYGIIHNHTNVGYDGLFAVYEKSDLRPDGKIWDMYSNATNFGVGDHNGNYHGEGDVYNREHSLPQSWFKETSDAGLLKADAYHVIPVDGYVNNRRSNYPYGEVKNSTYQSANGFSKLGPCSVSGYSGTVFEPNDLYKGDIARSYFYVATAYEGSVSGFNGASFAGNAYPAFSSWTQTMFMKWATNDPVSEKEVNRNDAIYEFQHNRNPFIDFPGLEEYIWGSKQDVAFDPDNYDGGGTQPDVLVAPTFSPEEGAVREGTVVTISCSTAGAYVYYTVNDEEEQSVFSSATVTIDGPTVITAYAMLGEEKSETVRATYTIKDISKPEGENVFYQVTSADELEAGANYLIVCTSKNQAMSAQGNDIRSTCEVTVTDGTIGTETGTDGYPYMLTLGGNASGWTFHDGVADIYLALTSSANKLHGAKDCDAENAQWHISVNNQGIAEISNVQYPTRLIQYNAAAPRFACYTGSQQKVSLFRQHVTDVGIAVAPFVSGNVNVLTIDGRVVRSDVPVANAFDGLPRGIYVVGGKKVLVR